MVADNLPGLASHSLTDTHKNKQTNQYKFESSRFSNLKLQNSISKQMGDVMLVTSSIYSLCSKLALSFGFEIQPIIRFIGFYD